MATGKQPDPNALRRAILKGSSKLRHEFNYDISLQRIDWTLDVLEPAKKEIADKFARGELDESGPLELD